MIGSLTLAMLFELSVSLSAAREGVSCWRWVDEGDGSTHLDEDGSTHLLDDGSTHLLDDGSTHLLDEGSTHLLDDGSTHLLEDGSTHLLDDGSTHWLEEVVGSSLGGAGDPPPPLLLPTTLPFVSQSWLVVISPADGTRHVSIHIKIQ